MIKGKTPEEIRTTFNIKNDFTAEEEEEVRRENQWAFEWSTEIVFVVLKQTHPVSSFTLFVDDFGFLFIFVLKFVTVRPLYL